MRQVFWTRRRLLWLGIALPVLGPGRYAMAQQRVDESDPLARELGYRHDARRVDTDRFPKRAGAEGERQFCRTCQFFRGGGEWGPCTVFDGRQVNAGGWCNSWFGRG